MIQRLLLPEEALEPIQILHLTVEETVPREVIFPLDEQWLHFGELGETLLTYGPVLWVVCESL